MNKEIDLNTKIELLIGKEIIVRLKNVKQPIRGKLELSVNSEVYLLNDCARGICISSSNGYRHIEFSNHNTQNKYYSHAIHLDCFYHSKTIKDLDIEKAEFVNNKEETSAYISTDYLVSDYLNTELSVRFFGEGTTYRGMFKLSSHGNLFFLNNESLIKIKDIPEDLFYRDSLGSKYTKALSVNCLHSTSSFYDIKVAEVKVIEDLRIQHDVLGVKNTSKKEEENPVIILTKSSRVVKVNQNQ